MFDVDIAFRQWLVSETTITDLVPAAHIMGGDLPQGANPGAGERWITFRPMPGAGHPEMRDYVERVFHVVFWAGKEKNLQTREAYRALRDLMYAVLMKTSLRSNDHVRRRSSQFSGCQRFNCGMVAGDCRFPSEDEIQLLACQPQKP
jgi:hypothetical protein